MKAESSAAVTARSTFGTPSTGSHISRPLSMASTMLLFCSDALLRFFGRTADVRRQDDVFQTLQRRHEAIRIRTRLDRKNVNRGAAKPAFAQRVGERLEVNDRTATVVDEIGARLDRGNLLATDHPMRG